MYDANRMTPLKWAPWVVHLIQEAGFWQEEEREEDWKCHIKLYQIFHALDFNVDALYNTSNLNENMTWGTGLNQWTSTHFNGYVQVAMGAHMSQVPISMSYIENS